MTDRLLDWFIKSNSPIASIIKSILAGLLLVILEIILLNNKNPLILATAFLFGMAFSILIQLKISRIKKDKQNEFEQKLFAEVQRIEDTFTMLENGEELSSLELNRVQPLISQYHQLRECINRGSVPKNIVEMLSSIAEGLENIEFRRNLRAQNARKEKQLEKQKKAKHTENEYITYFFKGCHSIQEIKIRYRNLCKAYHPDNGAGDNDTFEEIQKQYAAALSIAGGSV